jgi:hypothetical protein
MSVKLSIRTVAGPLEQILEAVIVPRGTHEGSPTHLHRARAFCCIAEGHGDGPDFRMLPERSPFAILMPRWPSFPFPSFRRKFCAPRYCRIGSDIIELEMIISRNSFIALRNCIKIY